MMMQLLIGNFYCLDLDLDALKHLSPKTQPKVTAKRKDKTPTILRER